MENNNNSNCPTMHYHNRLTEEQREKLGSKYIAEGTTIKDSKTGVVSDIVSVEHNGFKAAPQSSLDGFPKAEFFIPFEEIVDKHGRGIIEIGGYENTEPDHRMLILVVKDIMACNIIRGKENEIEERDSLISDQKNMIQEHIQENNKLNGILDNEKVEDVEISEVLAKGGIIGEVKASPIGIIKEVRDVDGKLLNEVYVGQTPYKRNREFSTYNSPSNDLLYRYDADKIHMAYGGIVGVEEKPNYYAVDIASPKKVQTCRVPAWATNVAESVKEGAKVTTCKAHGKWFLSSVLVPKKGITSNEAKHIGAEIRDKIQHRHMEAGGFVYESGTSSPKVNNLIQFADNTRSLVEMKDAINATIKSRMAKGAAPTREDLKKRFNTFLMKAKLAYLRERGHDRDSKSEVDFTPQEDDDFLNIYAEEAWINSPGPKMEEDADKVAARKYWDGFTKKDKLHFLLDHADYIYDKPASKLDKKVLTEYKKLSAHNWNKLPKEVQMAVEEHVIMGVYESGGEISGYTPMNEEQSKQLIGDDVKSTVAGILVLIEDCDDEDEKEKLRAQLKEYDYQEN